MQRRVSIDATIAIVIPVTHTAGIANPVKFGNVINALKSSADFGTGSFTK